MKAGFGSGRERNRLSKNRPAAARRCRPAAEAWPPRRRPGRPAMSRPTTPARPACASGMGLGRMAGKEHGLPHAGGVGLARRHRGCIGSAAAGTRSGPALAPRVASALPALTDRASCQPRSPAVTGVNERRREGKCEPPGIPWVGEAPSAHGPRPGKRLMSQATRTAVRNPSAIDHSRALGVRVGRPGSPGVDIVAEVAAR